MKTYKEIKDDISGQTVIEFIEGDKIGWIPTNLENPDYQEYLASLNK
jgi:hypothetical protein